MNFNALDLNLVRVFDALMAERSATRAGDRIGLSQPAVSAALNRLRHAFNDQLFIRRGNDMVPTPRAEELAGPARSALSQIEAMLGSGQSFSPASLERHFTLVGSDFVSLLLMPPLARRIAATAPGVVLRLLDTATGDLARLLRDDAVDLAIERPMAMPEGISTLFAFRSPFLIIAAKGHAAIAASGTKPGKVLPLDLFCSLPHALRSIDGSMSGATDDALKAVGRRRRVALALPHFQAVALAVAQGDYIAAIPSQFANAVADTLKLSLYQPPIDMIVPEIKLYWHARHDGEAAHRWLRDEVLAQIAALGF